MLSRKFINTIKLSPKKCYEIAHEAGIHPSMLSKLLNGIQRVKAGDPRILKVAKTVGIPPEECFENESPEGVETESRTEAPEEFLDARESF